MTMSDDVDLWVELEQLSVYLRLARSLEAVYGNWYEIRMNRIGEKVVPTRMLSKDALLVTS